MDVPNIKRQDYQLINIEDGFLTLMLDSGETKEDVKVPEGDLGAQLVADFEEGKDLYVGIVAAMGEEHCLSGTYNLLLYWLYHLLGFHSHFVFLYSQGILWQISLILRSLHLDICLTKINLH